MNPQEALYRALRRGVTPYGPGAVAISTADALTVLAEAGYTLVRAPTQDNLLVEVTPELLHSWGTRTDDGKRLSVAIGETRDGITELTFTTTDDGYTLVRSDDLAALRAAAGTPIETRARLADALDALRAAILWLHGDYRTTDRSQFDAESWYRKARSGVAALAADTARPTRECPINADGQHITYDGICHCGWSVLAAEARPGLDVETRAESEVRQSDTARPGLDYGEARETLTTNEMQERERQPDWALIDGTLRERLEYARDQHALAAKWPPGPQTKPDFHRACVEWYARMIADLTVVEAEARPDHAPECDVFRIADDDFGEPRHCDCGFALWDAKRRGVYNWTPPAAEARPGLDDWQVAVIRAAAEAGVVGARLWLARLTEAE